MSFFLHPLHYAAVTGNTALACYLYSKNITGKNVTVASFAAGGRNGQTSWRIPVAMSPSQTASLAGHAITAKALKYLESGIPLEWDWKQHSHFKVNDFKLKVPRRIDLSLETPLCIIESEAHEVVAGVRVVLQYAWTGKSQNNRHSDEGSCTDPRMGLHRCKNTGWRLGEFVGARNIPGYRVT